MTRVPHLRKEVHVVVEEWTELQELLKYHLDPTSLVSLSHSHQTTTDLSESHV